MDNQNNIINDTLKSISENKELKKFTEELLNNIVDINNIESNKNTDDHTNILNMYFLDEQGNNVCDILNKINNNLLKIADHLYKN